MRNLVFAASLAAVALVAFLAAPAVSLGSADGVAISDDHAASLYGGACPWQSTYPNFNTWCGPAGTCGTVNVTVGNGTTQKSVIIVACGNTNGCGSYPTQLTACGSK